MPAPKKTGVRLVWDGPDVALEFKGGTLNLRFGESERWRDVWPDDVVDELGSGEIAVISAVRVPENLRKQGIGRTLTNFASNIAASRGAEYVYLKSSALMGGPDPTGFYNRLGYEDFGESSDGSPIMRKSQEEVVMSVKRRKKKVGNTYGPVRSKLKKKQTGNRDATPGGRKGVRISSGAIGFDLSSKRASTPKYSFNKPVEAPFQGTVTRGTGEYQKTDYLVNLSAEQAGGKAKRLQVPGDYVTLFTIKGDHSHRGPSLSATKAAAKGVKRAVSSSKKKLSKRTPKKAGGAVKVKASKGRKAYTRAKPKRKKK